MYFQLTKAVLTMFSSILRCPKYDDQYIDLWIRAFQTY